ncbi:AAA family ATPase [Amnibacterium kyonggiense]|uniref:Putative kinase n=1 Tax=Amnibacterium kyonggiense TaxID=595671 RepID=A0A4R7FEL7_9MICO|nr:ATP-binding protein [Amnibacterium kyonggiense]TDS75813.1 putative kinase [Amnibacterium kyonggiense]
MTVYLLVGLPGAGKTTRAKELEASGPALRLTPDEWQTAIFDTDPPDGWRSPDRAAHRARIEGKLLETGMRAARLGLDVVLDFGLWSRDERSALRWIAASHGLTSEVLHLPVTIAEQRERIAGRSAQPGQFAMTEADFVAWQARFEAPQPEELDGAAIPPSPPGFADWSHWAAERWPSWSGR